MSIAKALTALDTQRNNLAANLVTKGVEATNTETLGELVPKVLNISSGYDTSDATATEEDIVTGKIAYIASGKVIGTHSCGGGSVPFSFVNYEIIATSISYV